MLVRLRQFAGPTLTRNTFTWQFLRVKSRIYINAFDEQFWIVDLPSLECLDGPWMSQGVLRNEMVAAAQVLHQRGIEVGRAGEAGLLDQVADAAIEALDHAVGLRMPGLA